MNPCMHFDGGVFWVLWSGMAVCARTPCEAMELFALCELTDSGAVSSESN